MTIYQRINPGPVHAIQWNGDNKTEIERFFKDLEFDLDDIGLFFSCDDDRYEDGEDHGDCVQFYSDGDDQEVDPGRWIVVESDRSVVVLTTEDFRSRYRAHTG